jgi:hypothetical protein
MLRKRLKWSSEEAGGYRAFKSKLQQRMEPPWFERLGSRQRLVVTSGH